MKNRINNEKAVVLIDHIGELEAKLAAGIKISRSALNDPDDNDCECGACSHCSHRQYVDDLMTDILEALTNQSTHSPEKDSE